MDYSRVKWLNDFKCCLRSRSVWWFEYVLKHIELEFPDVLPRYYRWIHNLVLLDGSYYLHVYSGEGSVVDVKMLGRYNDIDAGKLLIDLIMLYLSSYEDRRRSMIADYGEVFNIEKTYRNALSQLYKVSRFPVRAMILETLRELGDYRELSQSMFYINQEYVMMF